MNPSDFTSIEQLMLNDRYKNLPHWLYIQFALMCSDDIEHLLTSSEATELRKVKNTFLESKTLVNIGTLYLNYPFSEESYTPQYHAYISANYALTCMTCGQKEVRHYAIETAKHALNAFFYEYNASSREEIYKQRFITTVNNLTEIEKVLYGVR